MAKAKRKRRSKHRGTQAGTIEARGRTSRPASRAEARQQLERQRRQRRVERANRPPNWRSSTIRAGVAAGFLFVFMIALGQPVGSIVLLSLVAFLFYIPLGYYVDLFIFRRRGRSPAQPGSTSGDDSKQGPR